MAKKDEFVFPEDCCDICGAVLTDDAVVQEFADGSLARLCPDCAAGVTIEEKSQTDADFGEEDVTAEWVGDSHKRATADGLISESVTRTPKGAATDAEPAGAQAGIFEPEIFDAELFDAELAAVEEKGARSKAATTKDEATARTASKQGPADAEGDATVEYDSVEAGAVYDVEAQAAYDTEPAVAESPATADADIEATAEYESVEAAPEPAVEAATAPELAVEDVTEVEPAAAEPVVAPPAPTKPAKGKGKSAKAQVEPAVEAAVEAEPAQAEAVAEAVSEAEPSAEDAAQAESDAIDKTRELLMPVTDLITLQSEMQSALSRLASSLERFAADMIASEDKTVLINSRLHLLELELEVTRARLRETESLLPESPASEAAAAGAGTQTAPAAEDDQAASAKSLLAAPSLDVADFAAGRAAVDGVSQPPLPGAGVTATPPPLPTTGATMAPPPLLGVGAPAGPPPLPGVGVTATPPPLPITGATFTPPSLPVSAVRAPLLPTFGPPPLPVAGAAVGMPPLPAVSAAAGPPPLPMAATPPLPAGATAAPAHKILFGRKAHQAPTPEPEPVAAQAEPPRPSLGFTIAEVQAAQRYYNESPHVQKIRDIGRSIGKPKANLTHASGGRPQAIITIFWDIVWYQFRVDLRRDVSTSEERIVLDREGMDLDELGPRFREKNATVNEDGRLDASELEVRLLSDPSALISEMEMNPEAAVQTPILEDATEEIWDQQSAPEFRWD